MLAQLGIFALATVLPLGVTALLLGVYGAVSSLTGLLVGRSAQLRFHPAHRADVDETWASVEKAGSLLGWKSQTTLEEGIARSVAWYLENRDLAMRIALERPAVAAPAAVLQAA